MVYWDEKYNENIELKGIIEIICVKFCYVLGVEKIYYFSSCYFGLDLVDFIYSGQM